MFIEKEEEQQQQQSPPQKRFRSIRTDKDFDDQPNWLFVDVELEIPTAAIPTKASTSQSTSVVPKLEEKDFQLLILDAISKMFGEFGYRIQFELLKYRSVPTSRAFVKVLAKDYAQFRVALALVSQFKVPSSTNTTTTTTTMPCSFRFHKACHSLASLVIGKGFCLSEHIEQEYVDKNNDDKNNNANVFENKNDHDDEDCQDKIESNIIKQSEVQS